MMSEILKVVDFLVEGSREWNVDKLARVFWPIDRDLILSLPLAQGDCRDKWIWHFDAKGCYKVRSGYRVVMESRMTASSTNLNPDFKWWCLLWRLQFPSKVKLLIWRHYSDMDCP